MNETLGIVFLTSKPCRPSILLSSIITIPLGILSRAYENKTSKFLRPVLTAFIGLSPVIAGIVAYLIFPNHGILGSLKWLYTGKVVVIAQMLIITPIICSQMFPAIMPIRGTYLLNSLGLGLSPFRILRQVPREIKMSIIAVTISGFGRILAEVGVVMIVGGNICFKTRAMASVIALENNKSNYQMALQLGFILVIVSLIVNFSAVKFSKVTENDRT